MQEARRRFKTFYKVNSWMFLFLFGVGALVTANCLIHLTDFISFNCNNLPFLSYDPLQDCPAASPMKGFGWAATHHGFLLFGSASVVILCVLHVVLVYLEERILSKDYEPVPRI